jgi:hypothetical protein
VHLLVIPYVHNSSFRPIISVRAWKWEVVSALRVHCFSGASLCIAICFGEWDAARNAAQTASIAPRPLLRKRSKRMESAAPLL